MPLSFTPVLRLKREASSRVTNGIPLGWSLFLPVDTVNSVQTLKVRCVDQQRTNQRGKVPEQIDGLAEVRRSLHDTLTMDSVAPAEWAGGSVLSSGC
jgi:hypothetical protein